MKNFFKNVLLLSGSLLFTLLLIEIVLHFYNPLPARVRGNKIVLKSNVSRKIAINPHIIGLDDTITYTSNGLGFRGEEKPNNFSDFFSIVCVGGSTTECSTLSDENTWPARLALTLKTKYKNIWMNNAGIDGCSSYGHNILLDDYLLKLQPKMILFLVGVNDKGKANFDSENGYLISRKEPFIRTLIKKSELANLISNMYLKYKTQNANLGNNITPNNPDSLIEDQKFVEQQLIFHRNYQPQYKKRIEELVTRCLKNNITPVLITQSLLAHPASREWRELLIYNETTKQVAQENNIPLIALGDSLEKKKEYYFDGMHYTNTGAQKVAEIIYRNLSAYLDANKNVIVKN